MGLTVRYRHRRRQGCSHLRQGLALCGFGIFEKLEPRTPLAVSSVVGMCLAPGKHETVAGEIFYIDDIKSLVADRIEWVSHSSEKVGLGHVPELHSDPAAAQKIFLDFDGHVVAGTGWNELNRSRPINAPAFDVDGDPATFVAFELQMIKEIWSRVAEDFSPFHIDVTTVSPSARSFQEGRQSIRVLISSNEDASSGDAWIHTGNGVAYLNSWRYTTDTPVWAFANRMGANAKHIAESVSHELGHAFGLHHDGNHTASPEDEEYYAGHGTEIAGWAPIMGLGYDRLVTQWDQGEYRLANNFENDIETIASELNDIQVRPDDYQDHIIFASALPVDDRGNFTVEGFITTRTDQDAFRLELAAGTLELLVSPAEVGANLNLSVSLYGNRGQLISVFVSQEMQAIPIRADVTGGMYFVVVDGVGNGNPATNGFSDYGSIGHYSMNGRITPNAPILSQIRLAAKRLLP